MTAVAEIVAGTDVPTPVPDVDSRRRTVPVSLIVALAVLTLFTAMAILAPWLPLDDPLRADPRAAAQGPSADHWFGTDTLGRDLFSRCIFGARVSLLIGLLSSLFAAAIGSTIGFVAGFLRGKTETVLVCLMDALLAFPGLVLALALTAFLGASARNVVLAIAIVSIPVFGRLVRASTLTIAEREQGRTEAVIAAQLAPLFASGGVAALDGAVVAYEPVWAIGTGRTATPAQAQAVHAFIRGQVGERDAKIADSLPILYGGSCKPDNAAALFAQADVDGGLVGGASLEAAGFLAIAAAAAQESD